MELTTLETRIAKSVMRLERRQLLLVEAALMRRIETRTAMEAVAALDLLGAITLARFTANGRPPAAPSAVAPAAVAVTVHDWAKSVTAAIASGQVPPALPAELIPELAPLVVAVAGAGETTNSQDGPGYFEAAAAIPGAILSAEGFVRPG